MEKVHAGRRDLRRSARESTLGRRAAPKRTAPRRRRARRVVRRSFVGTAPTRFRHKVLFEGFLAGFWAARFGPRFRAELPLTMEALAALAEGEDLSES